MLESPYDMNHILPILCENPSRIKHDYSSLPELTAFPKCQIFIAKTGEVVGKRRRPATLAGFCITLNALHNLTLVFPTTPPSAAHPLYYAVCTTSAARPSFPKDAPCSCPITSSCALVPNKLTSHVVSVVLISWAIKNSSWSLYCHVSLLRGQD